MDEQQACVTNILPGSGDRFQSEHSYRIETDRAGRPAARPFRLKKHHDRRKVVQSPVKGLNYIYIMSEVIMLNI